MSPNLLTIVMYHFVRPLRETLFPQLAALDLAKFEYQLAYLAKFYAIVSAKDVLQAIQDNQPLPSNAALLTFDDGYKDHLDHVLPLLKKYKWPALFFPPSAPVLNRELLDVNRIHFILASVPDKEVLVHALEQHIQDATAEFNLQPIASFRSGLRVPSRFDGADVVYCKRLLQHALPLPLRQRIVRQLFSKYVSKDESVFADELYLCLDDLAILKDAGMEIGSHGHRHCWLGKTDLEQQAEDIDQSLDLLRLLGIPTEDFWFCYPYGSFNDATLALLKERSCGAAVTTNADLASLSHSTKLLLPRLDTNDLPQAKQCEPNYWTRKITGDQHDDSDRSN